MQPFVRFFYKLACLALLVCCVLFTSSAFAAGLGSRSNPERIEQYDVKAVFSPTGVMRVTENITFWVEGVNIKRGIVRTLPKQWTRNDKKRFAVQYTLREVLRNGQPEPYKLSDSSSILDIRIGSSRVLLPKGWHTYTIVYDVSNHFSRFDAWDELYWNVTGNDWEFPILKASFQLSFAAKADEEGGPSGSALSVPWRSVDVYTGGKGARGGDARILADGSVQTTQILPPGSGMTVAYTWDRSILQDAPAPQELVLWRYLLVPTENTLWLWCLPLFLAAALAVVWRRKSLPGGMPTVIPLFSPPESISPGELRFVETKSYDDTCFAGDLLNIVAKGALRFARRQEKDACRLVKEKEASLRLPLTEHESAAVERLFSQDTGEIDLKESAQAQVRSAHTELARTCRARKKELFQSFFVPCLLAVLGIFLLPLLALFTSATGVFEASFLLLFMSMGVNFFVLLYKSLLQRGGKVPIVSSIPFLGVFLFIFSTVFVKELGRLDIPAGYAGAWGAYVLVIVLFIFCAPRYTAEGLRRLAWAQGLRLYLGTAERERFEALYPPAESVEHFELLLPYALALGVGETWANRFASYLQAAGAEAAQFQQMDFGSLAAFTRDASRASEPERTPQSDSGFGSSGSGSSGGGSSGGGSGGGGGRGW